MLGNLSDKFSVALVQKLVGQRLIHRRRVACSRSRKTQALVSFLVSKLSSISALLGSRRKICQRVPLGTWFT